ncbi:DLW-39 family protein [Pseudonocardia ailaonensis]
MKKLLVLVAAAGAAFFVLQKVKARSAQDPWQDATR